MKYIKRIILMLFTRARIKGAHYTRGLLECDYNLKFLEAKVYTDTSTVNG